MTLTRHSRACVTVRYDAAADCWYAQCPVDGCWFSAERQTREAALEAAHEHEHAVGLP